MGVKLQSALGGSVELNAPSTASNFTMTVPAGNGTVATTDQLMGFRNRIINGAMMIDQRNAGASVTANQSIYTLDRFVSLATQTAKATIQQSVQVPAGFANSLLYTSSSSYSVLSTDYFGFAQQIEGNNIADLSWGTASAASVTLSFWVRSSLTGTFGGSLRNNAGDRSYPFSYTISAANTWEQKSITITGDTSGTWLTTNGIGIRLLFNMGSGSNHLGTAGAWAAANYLGATGQSSVVGTNGATFYITGVQLEKGSTATSFDYRPYGTELALCQRYYSTGAWATGAAYPSASGAVAMSVTSFKVTMRATPTVTSTSASYFNAQPINFNAITVDGAAFEIGQAGAVGNYTGAGTYKAEIEL